MIKQALIESIEPPQYNGQPGFRAPTFIFTILYRQYEVPTLEAFTILPV